LRGKVATCLIITPAFCSDFKSVLYTLAVDAFDFSNACCSLFGVLNLPFQKTKDFSIAHPDDLCFESGDESASTTGSMVDTLSELSSQTDSSFAETVEPQTKADVTLMRFQKQNLFWEKQSEPAPPPKSEAQLLALSLMLKKSMGTPPTNTNHKNETKAPSRELPLHATWLY